MLRDRNAPPECYSRGVASGNDRDASADRHPGVADCRESCRKRRRCNLDHRRLRSNTSGMKTAVSIPDDVFQDAERLASRLQTSRSKLYARALAEFVARHDDDRVTALMDQAVREAGGQADDFLDVAAKQAMQRAEW